MTSKMKRILIILAIIIAGSFIIAISLFYATGGLRPLTSSTNDVSQSEEIDASGVKLISISTVDTPVKIIADDGGKIKADFKGKVTTSTGGKSPELSIQKINEELKIEIIYPLVVSFGFFDISDLSLEIRIPEEFSGSIRTDTTSARVDVRDIKITELSVESVSGAVDIDAIESEYVEIKNTSGKCVLNDVRGEIYAKTVSGEISLNLNKLNDGIKVSTVSGAVRVIIPENSSFDFELSSISGKIENNFKSTMTYADRQSIKGTVGKGDFDIDINTTSGRILLDNN